MPDLRNNLQREGLTIRGTEYRPVGEKLGYVVKGESEGKDADNVLLMGCSQGGFVSALLASKWKEKIVNALNNKKWCRDLRHHFALSWKGAS